MKRIKYKHPKYIFFLYTLLRFGFNGIMKIPLGNFHSYSINGILKILEEYTNDGFTEEITIMKYTDSSKSEIYEKYCFVKGSNFYIKNFENIYFQESEINKFIIILEVNYKKIKEYLEKYFKLWYSDKFDTSYTTYISPKIQLDKICSIIVKYNNDRYTILDLEDIDEVSVIIYMYINNLIYINNDCLNIIEDNNKIFFTLIINQNKFEEYQSKQNLRILADYSGIVNNYSQKICTFTTSENMIIQELCMQYPDKISLENLVKKTKQTKDGCKQSIKMLKNKLKQLKINDKIDILSNRGSGEYSIKK